MQLISSPNSSWLLRYSCFSMTPKFSKFSLRPDSFLQSNFDFNQKACFCHVDKRGRGWEGEEGEVMWIRGVEDGRVRKVRSCV